MTLRFQRLILIIITLVMLLSAVLLILFNSKKNIIFFYTPSELIENNHPLQQVVRVGAFVEKESLKKITSNTYEFNKTPFYPSDFSTTFGTDGAGVYGRDDGVNLWGSSAQGKLQYVFGVFNGLESSSTSGANQSDNPLYGVRIAYNFLTPEKNPGYYTSST